jgi:glycosyltransferase involved in cell wall biosynthesis
MNNSKSIVHLIPHEGIGGVERAALTMRFISNDFLNFNVTSIFPSQKKINFFILWNPYYYIKTIFRLFEAKPEILILSLWRSCIVGFVLKLVQPKMKLVLFLHCPKNVHFLDRLFSNLISKISIQIWADSYETIKGRLELKLHNKSRVISFVTEKIYVENNLINLNPTFFFWGRIHKHKNLLSSLSLFSEIKAKMEDAKFVIIGPDGGDLERVKKNIIELNLIDSVNITGPLHFSEIKKLSLDASFYLQTSVLEGMALSVVEAMQLGLVPIITPVGEIKNYCIDGFNAVVIDNEKNTVNKVLDILNNIESFQKLRKNAINTWENSLIYEDNVLANCRKLLKEDY